MSNVTKCLQVDDDAATSEIKKAYRTLAKECHPDYLGDSGHNICILLNEVCNVRPPIFRIRVYSTLIAHGLSLGLSPAHSMHGLHSSLAKLLFFARSSALSGHAL